MNHGKNIKHKLKSSARFKIGMVRRKMGGAPVFSCRMADRELFLTQRFAPSTGTYIRGYGRVG